MEDRQPICPPFPDDHELPEENEDVSKDDELEEEELELEDLDDDELGLDDELRLDDLDEDELGLDDELRLDDELDESGIVGSSLNGGTESPKHADRPTVDAKRPA